MNSCGYSFSKATISKLLICFLSIQILSGCTRSPSRERISYDRPETSKADYVQPVPNPAPVPGTSSIPITKIKRNVYLEGKNVGGMPEWELRNLIVGYAAKNNRLPVDAKLNARTWAVSQDRDGRQVDVAATLRSVVNAAEGEKKHYVFKNIKAKVTRGRLLGNLHTIADFTTPLLDRRDSRINNIEIASRKLDHKIIRPGEEFSFNRTVGRRSAAKGYEEAPIIVSTPKGPQKKDAKGGGVCQISTTIYNAAEECGLKITERHLHSMDVGYVPRGEDATVSFSGADFKFVNNRKYPVMLRLYLKSGSITVKILENRNGKG